MTRPRLVAHRGYPARFPENTLVGMEAALEAGAEYFETDVQLTRDGVPVLFHDRTLTRVCGVAGAIHERTLEELEALSPHEPRRFGDRFRDLRIPTLEALVDRLAEGSAQLFVEVKNVTVEQDGVAKVLRTVLPVVAPLGERAMVISFSEPLINALRQSADVRRGFITRDFASVARQVADLDPEIVFCNVSRLPARGPLDAGGRPLAVYDVVDPFLAGLLTGRGADYIESFAIREMIEALGGDGG